MQDQELAPSVQRALIGTPAFELRTRAVFAAWNGVMVVAFSGFPPAAVEAKERLSRALPSLASENPGSTWPKCTIGCLRENTELTQDELQTLRNISSVSVVSFASRSLENLRYRSDIALAAPLTGAQAQEIAQEHRERVNAIIAEWENPQYLQKINRCGNRESHYRGEAAGRTLVAFLRHCTAFHDRIDRVCAAIDAALPNKFVWFPRDVRHVTLRSLDTK